MSFLAPTMSEVRAATGTNGLSAASLFAGCGGSSLGYRLAGFRVAYANEIEPHAIETYKLNADAGTVVDDRDVRDVSGDDICEAAGGDLDLLDSSSPCQDFSTAGRRNMAGERAKLSYQPVRLVGEARPRAFVFENVAGLAQGQAIGHLRQLLADFEGQGYRVACRILDASLLGVPQRRRRLIIIGFREDLDIEGIAGFPRPAKRRTTVRDALPHVDYRAPAPTVLRAGFDGGEVGEGLPDLTSTDFLRLSTFPDDFEVPGTESQRRARVGNAVPPLMAKAWATSVAAALLEVA